MYIYTYVYVCFPYLIMYKGRGKVTLASTGRIQADLSARPAFPGPAQPAGPPVRPAFPGPAKPDGPGSSGSIRQTAGWQAPADPAG